MDRQQDARINAMHAGNSSLRGTESAQFFGQSNTTVFDRRQLLQKNHHQEGNIQLSQQQPHNRDPLPNNGNLIYASNLINQQAQQAGSQQQQQRLDLSSIQQLALQGEQQQPLFALSPALATVIQNQISQLSAEKILALLRSNAGAFAGGVTRAADTPQTTALLPAAPPQPQSKAADPVTSFMKTNKMNSVSTSFPNPGNSSATASGTMNSSGLHQPVHRKSQDELEPQAHLLNAQAGRNQFSGGVPYQVGFLDATKAYQDQSTEAAPVAANMQSRSVFCKPVPSAFQGELTTAAMKNQGAYNDDKQNSNDRQTPRCFSVPCRARGMSVDHNFKNAYFLVSEDIQHGADLICSHLACRNGGVKFCYCAYCKVPVAKRNFRQRHLHAEDADYGMADTNDANNNNQPQPVNKKGRSRDHAMKNKIQAEGTGKNDAFVSGAAAEKHSPERPRKASPPEEVQVARPEGVLVNWAQHDGNAQNGSGESSGGSIIPGGTKPTRVSSDSETTSSRSKLFQNSREEMWAALLAKCPKEKSGMEMSAWLMEVITVSDKSVPLSEIKRLAKANGREDTTAKSGNNRRLLPRKQNSLFNNDDNKDLPSDSSLTDDSTDSCSSSIDTTEEPQTYHNNGSNESDSDSCRTTSGSSPSRNVRSKDTEPIATNRFSATHNNVTNYSSNGSSTSDGTGAHHKYDNDSSSNDSSEPSRRPKSQNEGSSGISDNGVHSPKSSNVQREASTGASTNDFSCDSREGKDINVCSNDSLSSDGGDDRPLSTTSNGESFFSKMTASNAVLPCQEKKSSKRAAMDSSSTPYTSDAKKLKT